MCAFSGLLLVPAAVVALTTSQPARPAAHAVHADPRLPVVLPNDNTQPAGVLLNDTLTLNLRAELGEWRPEGDAGPALRIEAFGEEGDSLRAPSPLIRVPEGTQIVVTIRNGLDAALKVHGLCARDGKPCPPLEVPRSAAREVSFMANRLGTFHYWATTTGMPLEFRAAGDTQLAGAFVVDPVGAPSNADRVFVITDWTSLTKQQLGELIQKDDPGAEFFRMNPQFSAFMNGLSWPATERLTYRLGETVRWRILNLSTQLHPMHLHGFYFDVDSRGDGWQDTPFADGRKPHVVTELMKPGATIAMTWRPERAGKWLFHCHRILHVSPERRLALREPQGDPELPRGVGGAPASHDGHHAAHDPSAGMAGMVLGITVVGAEASDEHGAERAAPRKLTLEMQSEPKRFGDKPAYGFVLANGGSAPPAPALSAPGPTLVLKRGEPVEITLINRMPEGTAVHWHGIELESYYDGVHGWSGAGRRVTPLIEPGGTFVVRFTPPRAGTFIYHTHLHDDQLASGLYGAIVVVEPGETFDPDTDHVVVMGRRGPGGDDAPAVLNGEIAPSFAWKAGVRHRIRFINITPDDVFVVTLQAGEAPVNWRPATKDGSPLPADQCEPRPAKQIIAVGETYDFFYDSSPGRRNLWLDVRSPGGKWMVQGRVSLK